MRPGVRAVIFDVDGTLIDSVDAHARCWGEILAQFGHKVPYAAVRFQIGKGGDQLMREFLTEAEVRARGEEIEAARKAHFSRNYLSAVRAFPQTRALFQRLLAGGVQVVLASSASGDELKTYKELAEITDLVQGETSKDDAEKSKPHPDIFEAALAKLDGVSNDEVVVVGDSPWDAIAAGRAGLRAIAVRCGGFADADLREAGFTAIFEAPSDLVARFDAAFA